MNPISPDQYFKYLVKVLLMGHENSGKSCIMNRFTDDTFDEKYIPTIGVDLEIRII